jgi:WD40 repeat protein
MPKKIIYAFFAFIAALAPSFAQSKIEFTDFDLNDYPTVKAKFFYYKDGDYLPYYSFDKKNISLKDNGLATNILGLNIPIFDPSSKISTGITIDLSIDDKSANSNFKLAKALAIEIAKNIPQNSSEISISSFETISYLNAEFTNNKTDLQNAINSLAYKSGSSINKGLLSEPNGAIYAVKGGAYNKSLLLISEGDKPMDADRIIMNCIAEKIKVYAVNFSPKANDAMKKICAETGGRCYENIGWNNYSTIARNLVAYMYDNKPIELEWANNLDCALEHKIEVYDNILKIGGDSVIIPPDTKKPSLEIIPPYLKFGAVNPGATKDINVSITAKNKDIKVNSISIGGGDFTIVSGWNTGDALTIPKNETKNITVRFSPSDSSIIFSVLTVNSDACFGKEAYISGGYPNKAPKDQLMKITSPNGGENILAGDTSSIRWYGMLPTDIIQLLYTTDYQKSLPIEKIQWDTLAKDVTGLSYLWNVPFKISDKCAVRAVQLWPNNVGQTLDFRHKNIVNCANFNGIDGDLVVSASADGIVRVWNSYTGALMKELKRNDNIVSPAIWANFDNSAAHVVAGFADGKVAFWDVNNSIAKSETFAHTKSVSMVAFSQDETKFASGGADGKINIFNAKDGTLIKTLNNGYAVKSIMFNKTSSKILCADVLGASKEFDINTESAVKIIPDNPWSLNSAVYNHAGDKILTCDLNGYAIVWDINSKSELFKVQHKAYTPMLYATFSEDDNTLITCANDSVPHIWNAANGSLIKAMVEHTQTVPMASLNFDGSRIITASFDSTAKVWNLNSRGLQFDVSDTVFSIIRAKLDYNDITLDKTAIDETKYYKVESYIKNALKIPFYVKDIFISDDNSQEFKIAEGLAPFKIDSLGTKDITIAFSPKTVGQRSCLLNVVIPGDTVRIKVNGLGYEPGMQLTCESIDFGKINLGDFKDTIVSAVIKNRSLNRVKINKVQNIGPEIENFDLLSSLDGLYVEAGQSVPISIRFYGDKIGRKNGVYQFEYEFTGSPALLPVYAETVSPDADSLIISIANTTAYPGDIIEMPLVIRDNGDKIIPNRIITGEIEYNASLLESLNSNIKPMIRDGKANAKFSITADIKNGEIFKFKFKAGLGDDTSTIVSLKNVSITDAGRIKIAEIDGIFSLKGVCKQGGLRLFDPFTQIILSEPSPNPTNSKTSISFGLGYTGNVKLFVCDMNGKNVLDLFNSTVNGGKIYSIDFNANTFSSGKYLLIFETPFSKETKSLEIEK